MGAENTKSLIKWGEMLDSLQSLVSLGLFGPQLKLRQQPDGSWSIMESPVEQVSTQAHLLVSDELTPSLEPVGGMGVLVGGGLSTDDPPPTLMLTDRQLVGPTLMVVTTTRLDEVSDYDVPAVLELRSGLNGGGDALNYFEPVGIIQGGKVMTLTRS